MYVSRVLGTEPVEAVPPIACSVPACGRDLNSRHPRSAPMTAGSPTIAPASDARPGTERTVAALVWLVWALTLASVLLFIALDGRNIPFEEDWLMVAPMTGHEPDLPRWLWSQNSEHRLPLPRLLNLALLRATGDFRSTMVFDTLALGAVAAGMILVARALRNGRTSVADAFFPLLLLHLGNWDNLVWGWQIQFVLPTVLACALLLIIVARPRCPARVTAAGAFALIGLPLSGANGLVFAPALAGWFACTAWARRRGPSPNRSVGSWLPAGAAFLAVLLSAVYFVGYESSPWNAPSPGLRATLETSGKFLALGVGPAAAKSWPLFGGVVSLILLASLGALRAARRTRDDERLRIIGLLAFFAAVAVLALAVGWGRAGRAAATGRMPTRYVLLAAPGLCAAYFTLLCGSLDRRAGGGAGISGLLFPFHAQVWGGATGSARYGSLRGDLASARRLRSPATPSPRIGRVTW
jgi:hypothetical protein